MRLHAIFDFYRAFNVRYLDGLAANWEPGDAPSMDNPMGASGLVGSPSVKAI